MGKEVRQVNPLQHLYDNFNHGDPAEKYRTLPDFPLMIDCEPTSACNFGCLMCPVGMNALGRAAEFMAWETWESIVDQCRSYGTALRLIQWGEPLLHPHIGRMIEYANQAKLVTHLNTNGSKLTIGLAVDLVDLGLTSIKFSFQGIDRDSYAEMRQIDFFDGMLDAIRIMREARGPNALPFISASTSITNETPEQVAKFREIIEPLVDQLTIGHTTFDFFDPDTIRVRPEVRAAFDKVKALSTVERKHPDPCPEVYGKLSIHADGSYAVCCNAYGKEGTFGNVKDMPIHVAWRHKMMEDYRKRLAKKDYDAPLCRDCYDYHGLTEGA